MSHDIPGGEIWCEQDNLLVGRAALAINQQRNTPFIQ
jgi:hypothetical protein